MKYLSGSELVGYIKERQAKQVRGLRQAHGIFPRLAIVQTIDDPVIHTYVTLKQRYGADILIETSRYMVSQDEAAAVIDKLNHDPNVHGIIVQLPLDDPTQTEALLQQVSPHKDVDGLGKTPDFEPATALAINWLCAGYNINLDQHKIAIIGQGRLVGVPLTRMWRNSGYDITTVDRSSQDELETVCKNSTLIVAGVGVPGLITSDMIRPDTIVIDAGTASDSGKIVGDIDPLVYERNDISITPQKGGVGPLTVAALFDNVIRAAQSATKDVASA